MDLRDWMCRTVIACLVLSAGLYADNLTTEQVTGLASVTPHLQTTETTTASVVKAESLPVEDHTATVIEESTPTRNISDLPEPNTTASNGSSTGTTPEQITTIADLNFTSENQTTVNISTSAIPLPATEAPKTTLPPSAPETTPVALINGSTASTNETGPGTNTTVVTTVSPETSTGSEKPTQPVISTAHPSETVSTVTTGNTTVAEPNNTETSAPTVPKSTTAGKPDHVPTTAKHVPSTATTVKHELPSSPTTKSDTEASTKSVVSTVAKVSKETNSDTTLTQSNTEQQKALSSGSVAAITIIVIVIVLLIFGGAAFWKIRHGSYGRLREDPDYGSLGNYNNPLYDDS